MGSYQDPENDWMRICAKLKLYPATRRCCEMQHITANNAIFTVDIMTDHSNTAAACCTRDWAEVRTVSAGQQEEHCRLQVYCQLAAAPLKKTKLKSERYQ